MADRPPNVKNDNVSHIKDCYNVLKEFLHLSCQWDRVIDTFSKLRTDEERVELLLNLDEVHSAIDVKKTMTKKSYESAVARREMGNSEFRKGHDSDAHELYTQSIQLFPHDLDDLQRAELAKSYSNRATTSYNMKEYRACLVDIDRALTLGYPDLLRHKLYEKQGKCYRELNEYMYDKAVCALKAGLDLLNILYEDSIPENVRKSQVEMEKLLLECEKSPQVNSGGSCKVITQKDFPSLARGRSDQYVNASELFTVMYDDANGRYGVATDDIMIGDVIMVEKPFVSVVSPDSFANHCYYCFTRMKSPLPCDHCIRVRYCTELCKTKAWLEYHQWECSIIDYIATNANGHLAHRIIVKLGYENIVKFRRYLQTDGEIVAWNRYGTNPGDVIDSTDYKCVHSLITHAGDRDVQELFFLSFVAVYILKCLEEVAFFPHGVTDDFKGFTGGMILSNLQRERCYSQGVNEVQAYKSAQDKIDFSDIGGGLYPTLSLLNHSCDPNVFAIFYGNLCVVRTLRKITIGEPILISYYLSYHDLEISQRQERLSKNYYFKCRCTACTGKWPLLNDIPDDPTLICTKCSIMLEHFTPDMKKFPCKNCGANNNVFQMLTTFDACLARLARRALDRMSCWQKSDLVTLEQDLTMVRDLVHQPSLLLISGTFVLVVNYAMDGNCNFRL